MAKNVLHKIKAYLYENYLTEDPNDFVARVSSERALSIDNVCDSAAARGGADISADSMKHAVKLFFNEMDYQLFDGFSVNFGHFTAAPSIKGVFNNPKEKFNPDKHSLLIQFTQGEIIRKELPSVEVEIMGVAPNGNYIAQVLDVKSGSVNDLLTPNRNLKIAGSKIKISGDGSDLGVYFVNQNDETRTKVDETDIVTNNPSEVIVMIPELAAGSYQLEIVTKYSGGKLLANANTMVFDKVLIVE